MPMRRYYQWNNGTTYNKTPVNETRICYVEAANCFMVGEVMPQDLQCARCKQGDTRFGECVIAFKDDGNPFMGGCCAHCRYDNHKEKCSYYVKERDVMEARSRGAEPYKIKFLTKTGFTVLAKSQALPAPAQEPVINGTPSTPTNRKLNAKFQAPARAPATKVATRTPSPKIRQPVAAVQAKPQGSLTSQQPAALSQNRYATTMGPITMKEPEPEEFPGRNNPTYRRRRVPASELRERAEGAQVRIRNMVRTETRARKETTGGQVHKN